MFIEKINKFIDFQQRSSIWKKVQKIKISTSDSKKNSSCTEKQFIDFTNRNAKLNKVHTSDHLTKSVRMKKKGKKCKQKNEQNRSKKQ